MGNYFTHWLKSNDKFGHFNDECFFLLVQKLPACAKSKNCIVRIWSHQVKQHLLIPVEGLRLISILSISKTSSKGLRPFSSLDSSFFNDDIRKQNSSSVYTSQPKFIFFLINTLRKRLVVSSLQKNCSFRYPKLHACLIPDTFYNHLRSKPSDLKEIVVFSLCESWLTDPIFHSRSMKIYGYCWREMRQKNRSKTKLIKHRHIYHVFLTGVLCRLNNFYTRQEWCSWSLIVHEYDDWQFHVYQTVSNLTVML